jgi:predicted glutamine amidotransferase
MCRMLAAVGRVSMPAVLEALRTMAENENAAYAHELRHLGADLRHDSGWGAAYLEGGGLSRHRSTTPCFEDQAFGALAGVETGLVILHARRTKAPETIAVHNTHPFAAELGGVEYAFCHNGEISDRSQLSWDPSLEAEGSIDSEELFLHAITRLDPSDRAASLERALAQMRDFTSLNCLLASRESVVAYSRIAPSSARPRYYTLWHGMGRGVEVVSSEIVDGLDVAWHALPGDSAIEIKAG